MSDSVTAQIHHDESEDKLHIQHSQDVSAVLSQNKRARDIAQGKRMGEMQRVASIPAVVAIEWMNEGINVMAPNREDLKRMKKKLNSPDYAYLRTGGGRL